MIVHIPHHGSSLATHSQRTIPLAHCCISAGEPFEASDDYELLDVNEYITKGREGFVSYKVTGDSMVEAIQPGYIVFVDPYCLPRNGDIVASNVNGKTCVKYFERNSNGLYLVPANKKYPPQQIKKTDDFRILGVVKAHLAVY